jgi:hypothetical protein
LPISQLDTQAHDLICRCLSPRDLCALLRVNRHISTQVQAYMRRAYNINRILLTWFDSPDNFRQMQARTGTIISGSQAVQFLERVELTPSRPGSEIDFDIYCDHLFAREVVEYLQLQENYVYRPREDQERDIAEALAAAEEGIVDNPAPQAYTGREIAGVFDFSRQPGSKKIQLITAKSAPLAVILGFHSSKCVKSTCVPLPMIVSSVCDECAHPFKRILTLPLLNIPRAYCSGPPPRTQRHNHQGAERRPGKVDSKGLDHEIPAERSRDDRRCNRPWWSSSSSI